MCYFGGGIGHLKNAPPLQVPGFDPIDPTSEEMAVEDDNNDPCSSTYEDLGAAVQQPSRDVAVNSGELVQLQVGEDDEDDEDDEEDNEDSDDDEGGDQTDEDEDGDHTLSNGRARPGPTHFSWPLTLALRAGSLSAGQSGRARASPDQMNICLNV